MQEDRLLFAKTLSVTGGHSAWRDTGGERNVPVEKLHKFYNYFCKTLDLSPKVRCII